VPLLLVLSAGCASTAMVNMWNASINPTSARAVNREIADIIVPELLRQRVTAGP
jgi:hypothetical protein